VQNRSFVPVYFFIKLPSAQAKTIAQPNFARTQKALKGAIQHALQRIARKLSSISPRKS
jgi:hypothetical protein